MEQSTMVVITMIHAMIAVFATALNVYTTNRRLNTTTRNDSTRLRVAIAAELANLKILYKVNIDAIYESKDMLMSSRLFIAIYRGNLGRLHTLHEKELPAIVTAYAQSERLEAFLAGHCKPHGQSAFGMAKERTYAADLIALYEKASATVDRALTAMGEADDVALSGFRASMSRVDDPDVLAAAGLELPRFAAPAGQPHFANRDLGSRGDGDGAPERLKLNALSA